MQSFTSLWPKLRDLPAERSVSATWTRHLIFTLFSEISIHQSEPLKTILEELKEPKHFPHVKRQQEGFYP